MSMLWITWLVLCCTSVLVAVFKPKSEATKPLAILVLLGVLTFFVWLTDGRLAGFIVLGLAVALPVFVGLIVRQARKSGLPTTPLGFAAWRMFVPALVFGGLIAAGIELGGRFSGSAFVIWRACVGGALVLVTGTVLFARGIRPNPAEQNEP